MREVASYLGVSVFWDGKSSEGALCICCSAGSTDHPQLFFDYLSCEVCSYTIVMKNVMKFTVEVACKKESEFNGVPIAIDGSIRADILDSDQVIANAFICADGFGVTDFNKVGFRGKKKYTVIAMTTGKSNFNKNIKYTFRFSPEHIWIVEK